MEAATELTPQELALAELRETFGPLVYTEDRLNFRLVGFYTDGHRVVQATGGTWNAAIVRLKEKATSPRRIAERDRWPWRSTLITG